MTSDFHRLMQTPSWLAQLLRTDWSHLVRLSFHQHAKVADTIDTTPEAISPIKLRVRWL